MKSKTKELLKELEEYVKIKSYKLPIFKGYNAINKRGVEHLIDMIYATLPDDVMQARKYLRSLDVDYSSSKDNGGNFYNNIQNLEAELDKSYIFDLSFAQFAIVNINKLENIIDKIYSSLPKELSTIERINK
ncbi:MAG: hypothetical protein NC191_04170 [Muribaculaceae bacterium]|nr:hypothetical protein [Muribaculaceae bacterium]